jgi:hypothetical protein
MLACLCIPIGAAAAGANETVHAANPFPGTWRIKAIKIVPDTTAAANDTNYATVTITTNNGAGGSFGSAIVTQTTQVTGGIGLTTGTTLDLTLTESALLELSEGEQVRVAKTYAASGAVVDGLVVVMLEKLV